MPRIRLTYANVVATLALFVALGGTSVAASSLLNGSKIKPGSIPANRIKKHSLTATEVNVAKLGTVPAAQHAGGADTATHAAAADNATHSATADEATHAATADTVGGLTPGALMADSRTLVGAGDSRSTPAETIIDSPLGFRLQTDGAAGYDRTVTLVNKTQETWSVINSSGAGSVRPGESAVLHQGNSPLSVADSNEVRFLYQAIPLPRREAYIDCWFPGAGSALSGTLIFCSAMEIGA